MSDHLVSMPTMLDSATRDAIATLALAGSFASPAKDSASKIESDLLTRFSASSTIDPTSVIAWLESSGMVYQDLAGLVAQISTTIVPLHTAMQSQIDAGGVVLLQVENASLLNDANITDTPTSLHPGNTGSVWLVRSGYSDDRDFGFYYDLAARVLAQPVHILWSDVLAAGIISAIALNAPVPPVPPKPPIDETVIVNALHIIEQAQIVSNQAIASIATALGLA